MRVVHIMKVILVAGAERHLLTLLPALRALGVDGSILLLTEPDKPMDNYIEMARAVGVDVHREMIHRHADASLLPRVTRHLRDIQPDIVHTHLLHADLYGVLAARGLGVPAVVSRHNDNAFRRKPPMRLLHALWWRLAQEGVAISDAIRAFCITVEHARPDHIHTVRYGVHANDLMQEVSAARADLRQTLNLPPDALIVGTMSRLIEQKGLRYGIEAFRQIQDTHPNAHLVISGGGVLRDALEQLTHETNTRAHFIGWQPQPTQILAGYDVLLMPSLWEGFGLVMLEAMAQGVPIVGSAVSAIPEVVVNGETGLLVPPCDVDGLAAALARLLREPQMRGAMGVAAQARLRAAFSAERMAHETLAVYQRAVNHSQ